MDNQLQNRLYYSRAILDMHCDIKDQMHIVYYHLTAGARHPDDGLRNFAPEIVFVNRIIGGEIGIGLYDDRGQFFRS